MLAAVTSLSVSQNEPYGFQQTFFDTLWLFLIIVTDSHTAPITPAPWTCKSCLHFSTFSISAGHPSGQAALVRASLFLQPGSFIRWFPTGTARSLNSEGLPSPSHPTGTGTVWRSSCRWMARKDECAPLLPHLSTCRDCPSQRKTSPPGASGEQVTPAAPWEGWGALWWPAPCTSSPCREQDKPPCPQDSSQVPARGWHGAAPTHGDGRSSQALCQHGEHRACLEKSSPKPCRSQPVQETSLPEQQHR